MRKPLSILILSLLFLLSPLAILVFNAALNMVPLIGYGSILYRLRIQDLLILSLYPVAALSIFLVKKWGWWTLVSSALLMILYNLVTLFYNPFASTALVLLMNGALFAVALLFFRKHLIAPYFHPRLRWWEQDQRYEIDIYLKFLGTDRNVIISDISEGGCYIFVDYLIETGAEVPVMIVCGAFHITLQAKVMRIARESEKYYGFGLMFLKMDEVQKAGLDKLLKKLKTISADGEESSEAEEKRSAERYFIAYDLSLTLGEETRPLSLSDISMSGCSLFTTLEMAAGDRCKINLVVKEKHYSIESSVVWKKSRGEQRIYGVKFTSPKREQRKALRYMISSAKKLGAVKRETDKEDYYRRCDEEARQTPYRVIEKILRLFRSR